MSTFEKSSHVLQPQQQRSRDALTKIVEAAEYILRTDGVAGFSMAAIAEASGLPVGNIYRRFRGKSDILLAVKEDVTARIEHAILSKLDQKHGSFDEFVSDYVSVLASSFSQDDTIHRVLFDPRIKTPAMDKRGAGGRWRIFTLYREMLMPFLTDVGEKDADTITRVSFHIIMTGVIARATSVDAIVAPLSWRSVAEEYALAAIGYITKRRKAHTAGEKAISSTKRQVRQKRRPTR